MGESPAAEAAEIKISFAGAEAGAAFEALALDRDEARHRVIHFWDRPERSAGDGVALPLLDRGIILRLRRDNEELETKRDADMTVKLRPCPALPTPWRESREGEDWEFRIEEDRTGPAFEAMLSASLEAEGKFGSALEAEAGSPDRMLIEPQLELLGLLEQLELLDLSDAGGPGEDRFDGLTALGPVHAAKWKEEWDGLPGTVAIEEWTTGQGLRFLEVSVRTAIAEAAEVQERLGRALRERDISPPAFGETKTRAVMTALARTVRL
ncbi:hypothetical protein [Streptomyces sp. NBC_01294]|uniref:hypothetical protein n=1 Tax=Streptomyces sp. NBC_01294 TaxID=2903815 RepID=UPI002DD889D2|nr:hypothetical protein [Streptomyces sp. NBC_01294]WRZ55198.1 hypothetical protein OG534_00980 [Streptomyces sp. NBC_01294]WRZ61507.1 hypothetical protein OG534_36505 [Streptomyces sp. NBC_01294]